MSLESEHTGDSGLDGKQVLSNLVYTIRSKNIDSTIKDMLIARANSIADQVVAVGAVLTAIVESDGFKRPSGSKKTVGAPTTEEVARAGLAVLMSSEKSLSTQFNEYMKVLVEKEQATRPKKA